MSIETTDSVYLAGFGTGWRAGHKEAEQEFEERLRGILDQLEDVLKDSHDIKEEVCRIVNSQKECQC